MVEIPVGQSVAPDLDFAKVEILIRPKKKDFARSYFRQLDIRHFSQYVNFFLKHASGAIRRIFGNETKLNK